VSDRLFTPRFFIMCAYSFTVFVSVFQLLPTAPYHIIDLGGTTASAGLFLGSLTYSSALSAPLTGTVGDRVGQRRVLITVSLILALFSASYAFITDITLLLAVVFVHGLFWSALLSASGAYMTGAIPAARRAEGIGYWGLTSALSVAVAPTIGFWVYHRGWSALCLDLVILNLLMAFIAWRLPEDSREPAPAATGRRGRVEWRVIALSLAMAVISFGYGGLTSFSALFADELHVSELGSMKRHDVVDGGLQRKGEIGLAFQPRDHGGEQHPGSLVAHRLPAHCDPALIAPLRRGVP